MHLIVCNFTPYFVDFQKNLCTKQKNTEDLVSLQDTNLRYESSLVEMRRVELLSKSVAI